MMYLTTIITLLASLTLAIPIPGSPPIGPSGHEVIIESIATAGSGCPAGSVVGQFSSDLTTLTLLYDSFIAQAGKGLTAASYRRNCQLNAKLRYPAGWQFSVFKADYRGYAQVPAGDTGTVKATYYFSGDSHQASSTLTISGPYEDNYHKEDNFGVQSTVWSPCGAEGLLNINSEVRLSPADATKNAQLTVDSTDLKFTEIHYLQWQTCKK